MPFTNTHATRGSDNLLTEAIRVETRVAAVNLPVSLGEAKMHLRVDDENIDQDPLIEGLIRTFAQEAEKYTGRAIITQELSQWFDRWPALTSLTGQWWDGVKEGAISDLLSQGYRYLELTRPPLQSVQSILTYDDADASTVYAASNYFVDNKQIPGRIVLRDGASTPAPQRVANGIEVRFIAGYGDNPGDVPEVLRLGILQATVFAYENRGECEITDAIKQSGADMLWATERNFMVG